MLCQAAAPAGLPQQHHPRENRLQIVPRLPEKRHQQLLRPAVSDHTPHPRPVCQIFVRFGTRGETFPPVASRTRAARPGCAGTNLQPPSGSAAAPRENAARRSFPALLPVNPLHLLKPCAANLARLVHQRRAVPHPLAAGTDKPPHNIPLLSPLNTVPASGRPTAPCNPAERESSCRSRTPATPRRRESPPRSRSTTPLPAARAAAPDAGRPASIPPPRFPRPRRPFPVNGDRRPHRSQLRRAQMEAHHIGCAESSQRKINDLAKSKPLSLDLHRQSFLLIQRQAYPRHTAPPSFAAAQRPPIESFRITLLSI